MRPGESGREACWQLVETSESINGIVVPIQQTSVARLSISLPGTELETASAPFQRSRGLFFPSRRVDSIWLPTNPRCHCPIPTKVLANDRVLPHGGPRDSKPGRRAATGGGPWVV